ncbi:DsbA family protein [Marinobacter caseinilyticus]|uniref:DsbA family protein n=1 Tax=Marinobacter caseinilyticus TaxID=2692195 RepID=UPI0014082B23|nr:DsbA family protein [Marinobacter caseinilyticus]
MGEAKRRKESGTPGPQKSEPKKRTWLPSAAVSLVAILLIGVFFITRPPSPDSGALPVTADDAEAFPAQLDRYGVSVGAEDAPVVVREFADYQCPACGRFASASQRLKKQYVETGKVRFVFFDFPLKQHENAMPAAQAARCAGDQDAYWPMHDRLFSAQSEWNTSSTPVEVFTRYAGELGLQERRFKSCLTSELHLEDVTQSRQVAVQLRVASTPTVMVDNIRLTQPGWAQLSAVVKRELAGAVE